MDSFFHVLPLIIIFLIFSFFIFYIANIIQKKQNVDKQKTKDLEDINRKLSEILEILKK